MKQKLGGINLLYPTPTTIAGAIVKGRPNFITIAHIGILNHAEPHLISLSMGKTHYTNQGIKENKVFSVNIPAENLVAQADYVGTVTGKKTDKSDLFDIFYGELENAPMIRECPINMGCRLYDVYNTPTHEVFIGEITETHADESVLTDGTLDLTKFKPILFDMSSKKYWSIGSEIAKCWNIGMEIKKKMQKYSE